MKTYFQTRRNEISSTRFLAAVLSAAACVSLAEAAEFRHSFGGQVPHPAMRVYGKEANRFVKRESGAIRITLPANREGRDVVGVSPVFSIAGDFEITFGYELLTADAGEDNQVGVNMRVMAGNPARQVADWGRYRGLGNQDGYVAKRTADFDTDERVEEVELIPTKSKKGLLRLQRTGSTLRYLISEGRGGDFQEVHHVDFIPDECRVRLATVAGKGQSIDVRYLVFHVKADELPNAQPEWTRKSRAWLWWLIGLIAVGGGVGGFFLWRSRSGEGGEEQTPARRRAEE